MLDIKKILGRSWHIVWNYRMLWVFGFILALTIAGGTYSGNGGSSSYRTNNNNPGATHNPVFAGDTLAEKMSDAFRQAGAAIQTLIAQHPVEFRMGLTAAILVLIMLVFFGFIGAILRYVSETATIRMVDEYEQTGLKVGFRQGWKYGWSRASWRLFLINLLVHIPALLLFVVLGLCAWWIFSAAIGGVQTTFITSLIAGVGLAILSILFTVVVTVILSFVRDFAWRFAVLEDTGVIDSLRQAAALIRNNWKSAGVMWLVMIGIKIVWGLVFLVLIFPLLILCVITGLAGLFVALIPGLLTAAVASLFAAPGYWPWVFAGLIALPFFFPIAWSPILLVRGWSLTYESSVWTLTYRELKALQSVAPALPEVTPLPEA